MRRKAQFIPKAIHESVAFNSCNRVLQFIKKMRLSHLDAEDVVSFSSAYKSTPEGENAAKNYT